MGGALAIFQLISQNLPMIFSDITIVKGIIDLFKSKGVDVTSAVATAMIDADAEGKKLLAS
jgi:hypothetical protein